MDEIKINGKAIYTTKGAAREYGRVGCNFYTGCPHNCEYCYLKRGRTAKTLGDTEIRLKKCFKDEDDAIEVFCKEVRKHFDHLKETGVFFSFTTDPMIPETIDLTLSAWNMCIYNKIPVKVLTKDASFVDNKRMQLNYHSNAVKDFVHLGFTLTGHDEMEPGASTNDERIGAMRILSEKGFRTWASIEPVIDFTSSLNMVKKALDAGCQHFKIGLLTMNSKPCRDKYSVDDCIDFIVDVMKETDGKATVYWKRSVREFVRTSRKPSLTDDELRKVFDVWRHSVDSRWCMPIEKAIIL